MSNSLPKTYDDALEISEALWANLQVQRESDSKKGRTEKKGHVKTVKTETGRANVDSSSDEDDVPLEVRQLSEKVSNLEHRLKFKKKNKPSFKFRKNKKYGSPQKKRNAGDGPPECWNCRWTGHIQRYCPFERRNSQPQATASTPLIPKTRPHPRPQPDSEN